MTETHPLALIVHLGDRSLEKLPTADSPTGASLTPFKNRLQRFDRGIVPSYPLPRLICQTGVKAGFFVGCILAKTPISPRRTVFEFKILAFKKEDLIEQLFPQYKLLLL